MEQDSSLSTEAITDLLNDYLRDISVSVYLYFKSKFIAADVGLSPKEIGAILAKIRIDSTTDFQLEKWAYTSATTWRVIPASV